ncbi:baseplate J/gp47 family protein [Paenibacillus sinopodophylli]|uniref:baseplate J/gp47 family protein n=1 Tax=Paenibacillus sinopodophylli TaxID=1837342 RepID=UPI001FEB8266|nr:baseplate J/gp47 family protein [Paenibacillus sinopodophylli]
MKHGGSKGGDNRPPKINHSTLSSFMSQLKEMAPHYTPEWRFSQEEPDAGTGLAYLTAEMLEGTVKRLNQAPLNHFLSFLDLIEVKLQPPRPARASVVFQLSEGTVDPVYLPAGIALTAPHPEGGEPLVFETEKVLLATPAKLMEWINVHPKRDHIATAAIEYGDRLKGGLAEPVSLFDTSSKQNEQEHVLYIRHDDLFLVDRPSRFYLNVHHTEKRYSEPELAASLASQWVEWTYYCNESWVPFDSATAAGNMVVLHKQQAGKLEMTEHEGINGRWIRCTLKQFEGSASPILNKHLEMDKIRIRAAHDASGDDEGIAPGALYFNDTELMNDGFYPFGEHFVPYSVFYLSCEEAFSKRESKIKLTFSAKAMPSRLRMAQDPEVKWKMVMRTSDFEEKDPPRICIRSVQWEYWDGGNWARLPGSERYGNLFAELPEQSERSVKIEFNCPEDMTQAFVNGASDYWIRARVLQTDPIIAPVVEYMSPWLANPVLSYAHGSQTLFMPEHAYTRSNIDNRDRTISAQQGGQSFKLFESIEASYPAMYASFDRAPLKGPIRLHIELERRFSVRNQPPWVEWEALCLEAGRYVWEPLKIVDNTESFTVSGEVQWVGPKAMAMARLFGRERYWIRAVNRDSVLGDSYPSNPVATSMNLNAVSVRQQISQEKELTIPSDGIVDLTPSAYIEEEVWVDELEHVTPMERSALSDTEPDRYMLQKDSDGNDQRFWVKWQPVVSLAESGPIDRHYSPDHAGGTLQFGDGIRGKMPSSDTAETVRVRFKTTSGASGHVDAGQITGMVLPFAFVSSVSNPAPSIGGGDAERVEQVLERGPQRLKHRGRAVTAKDVEWIAREAYPQIAKVKCLSNRNGFLERSPGCMTVVAFPSGGLANAAQFPELRKAVERELTRTASNMVSLSGAIRVIEPAYLEVSVHATVASESVDELLPLEIACTAKLNAFLDSVTGNVDGCGWNIGEALHVSVLHSLLHAVRSLLYIERLYLHVIKIENGVRTEYDPARMEEVIHGVVVNGTHTITAVPAPK